MKGRKKNAKRSRPGLWFFKKSKKTFEAKMKKRVNQLEYFKSSKNTFWAYTRKTLSFLIHVNRRFLGSKLPSFFETLSFLKKGAFNRRKISK